MASLAFIYSVVGSDVGCIREQAYVFRPKIGKKHAAPPDHERWLGYHDDAFAKSKRGIPTHTQRIYLAAGGRNVGDTPYLNAVRCINRRASFSCGNAASAAGIHSKTLTNATRAADWVTRIMKRTPRSSAG